MLSEETFTAILIVALISFATWMTINTILEHRREMAKIKRGADTAPQLAQDNIELRETVGIMQDRLAVLEQITIDPALRTAKEIEELR